MTDYATLFLPRGSLADLELESIDTLAVFGSLVVRPRYASDQACIQMDASTIFLTAAPKVELEKHVHGLESYVKEITVGHNSKEVLALLAAIRKASLVIGCVIEPGFDDEGKIGGLLSFIASAHDGVLFSRDSIFDSLGRPLLGPLATRH